MSKNPIRLGDRIDSSNNFEHPFRHSRFLPIRISLLFFVSELAYLQLVFGTVLLSLLPDADGTDSYHFDRIVIMVILSIEYNYMFAKGKEAKSAYIIVGILYYNIGIYFGHWVYKRFKGNGSAQGMMLGGMGGGAGGGANQLAAQQPVMQ